MLGSVTTMRTCAARAWPLNSLHVRCIRTHPKTAAEVSRVPPGGARRADSRGAAATEADRGCSLHARIQPHRGNARAHLVWATGRIESTQRGLREDRSAVSDYHHLLCTVPQPDLRRLHSPLLPECDCRCISRCVPAHGRSSRNSSSISATAALRAFTSRITWIVRPTRPHAFVGHRAQLALALLPLRSAHSAP